MAERRMFAKSIIDSDAFLDMPLSAQALYFHLSMRADDDGFVNNPRKIQRMISASDDDLKLLIAKQYVFPFESGIVVIKHWKIHNYIQKDRYHPTVHIHEKALISPDESGAYALDLDCIQSVSKMDTKCLPDGNQMDTEVSLGKSSTGKSSVGEGITADKPPKRTRFIPPTVDEVRAYCEENGYQIDSVYFVDYYTANGWMTGKNKMKDWRATVRNWSRRETERQAPARPKHPPIPGVPTL